MDELVTIEFEQFYPDWNIWTVGAFLVRRDEVIASITKMKENDQKYRKVQVRVGNKNVAVNV